ncbi:ATP-binding protein [Desulfoluna spongiiphila]|uniref:histidine kinase n=1 Tax=Desulfoluna spongiiphila TaxID=419481 RepID=A0A1G5IZB7_9BACT|nr:ATP-binding protein [Desulfoluna spongiiphila]SCY81453.1 His Kinase A (phospho-acceptor) domain-containing protein [Desulfoluna spongiiphila]
MRRIPIRIFIFIFISLIIAISSIGTGFILMREAEYALLQEKQRKLFALARVLDSVLVGTFDEILDSEGLAGASREARIGALNRRLRAVTDRVALSEPGVGVGYYSRSLDAIITYGPSETLGHKVGQSISADHKGRFVMATGMPRVQTAGLVRGEIMNCMYPINRDGEVIGYIWSNELMDDINDQIRKMLYRFYVAIAAGIVFSFAGTAFIAHAVGLRIREIKRGIKAIETDVTHRIAPMGGELGEIAVSVNEFAEVLESRRRLEEQMQRTDRLAALGEIAAGVAHEIRNPMTSIKGFVQLIETGMEPEDVRRKYTSIVIAEVDRLNKMVRELLYYARPSDSLKLAVDINGILADTLLLVNLNATRQHVQIVMDYGEDLPRVVVDQEQIKQVFLNILINAVQAVENGGHIRVESMALDRGVAVVVEDDGKGIEPAQVARLFDPFFTTRDNGTGLGLAVVQKIIDLHHGVVEVESRLGEGTRFRVVLPAKPEGDGDGN